MAKDRVESKEKSIHDGISPICVPEGRKKRHFKCSGSILSRHMGKHRQHKARSSELSAGCSMNF